MRVVLVTRRYWPAIGGVERVVMSLGAGIAEQGDEVTVVAQRIDSGPHRRMTHVLREAPAFAPHRHGTVSVRQLRLSPSRRALLLPFVVELIPLMGRLSRRRLRWHTSRYHAAVARAPITPALAKADIVHVLGGDLLASAIVDAAHRSGLPAVISPFAHPGAWGMDAGSVRAYREADLVLATTAADAAVYGAAGVEASRLRVVGLPVPALEAAPGGNPAGEDPGPLVVFMGARRATKGVELLQDAAELLWRSHPDVRFAFIGPGPALRLRDRRVLDVGEVPDAERGTWLASARLLCLPSDGESFGLVVAEAWTLRVPVVVSDIPVLRELVERSGGGLVAPREPAPLAAAIARLVDDDKLAHDMGAAGWRDWHHHYRPHAVVARNLAAYREAVAAVSD